MYLTAEKKAEIFESKGFKKKAEILDLLNHKLLYLRTVSTI
jgi:hypothetical protein